MQLLLLAIGKLDFALNRIVFKFTRFTIKFFSKLEGFLIKRKERKKGKEREENISMKL